MALIGAAGVGAGIAACDSGGRSGFPGPTRRPASTPGRSSATSDATRINQIDAALRAAAVADERRLLLACAAPVGLEPFATLRTVHLAHLRALTSSVATPPAAASQPPAAAAVAGLERELALARRADCGKASPTLAPLLASLAASGNVAAALLTP